MKKKKITKKVIGKTNTPIVEMVERNCFFCNGTGSMCNVCGEAENVCGCEDGCSNYDCENCKGTGKVMVPAGGLL